MNSLEPWLEGLKNYHDYREKKNQAIKKIKILDNMEYQELTHNIIGAAMEVHNNKVLNRDSKGLKDAHDSLIKKNHEIRQIPQIKVQTT